MRTIIVEIKQDMIRKLSSIIPVIILFLLNFLFFTPIIIYNGNYNELEVSLLSILSFFTPLFIILFIIFSLIPIIYPRIASIYIVIIFVLANLIWLQGNIIAWEYGLLDGKAIDWMQYNWRGWVDATSWGILLFLACFFHKKILTITTFASISLIILQLVNIGFISFRTPAIWRAGQHLELSRSKPPPEIIYNFSSSKNVIHIILDAFQSDLFEEIINENIDYYSSALSGFTFFRNNIGSFPTTIMSIPAIFTGENHRNNISISEFIEYKLGNDSVINTIYDHQYDVELIQSINTYCQGKFSLCYTIPFPYNVNEKNYIKSKSFLIFDLSLFRIVPHFFKKLVYNDQLWLTQSLFLQNKKEFASLNHKLFFEDIIQNMIVEREDPVYKFIHLQTTHSPMITDKQCNYTGKVLENTRNNIKIQLTCGLNQFIRFLNQLRFLGIYDNSLIVLQSDHGAWVDPRDTSPHTAQDLAPMGNSQEVIGSALALMVVKPSHQRDVLSISDAPTMLTDTPKTLTTLLRLPPHSLGQSVFDISPDAVRQRPYYYYTWRHAFWKQQFLPPIDTYIVSGHATDQASWKFIKTEFADNTLHQVPFIDFGTPKAELYLLKGWGANEKTTSQTTFNWALGPAAVMRLALPPSKSISITANLISYPFETPQIITITIDGEPQGQWEVSNTGNWQMEERRITIAPNPNRGPVSIIRFDFSHYRSTQGTPETRPLAVLFESLIIGPAQSEH